jgi:peptide/nickel transport system permease protein
MTDGELPIETSVESGMSKSERYRLLFEKYVKAPASILWDDIRTRVGTLIILGYVLMGTVGVHVIPKRGLNAGDRYMQPFQVMKFPLGTDGNGQGLLELVVHATPNMLKMVFAGAVFAITVATIVGTISGFVGGAIDRTLMYVTDVTMSIPGLPLIIVLAAFLEPRNPYLVGLLLSINAWAGLARAIRSQVLTVRDLSYVESSKAMGIPMPVIVATDILPNLMPYILINFAVMGRRVIYASVALYYLGVLPITGLNWGVILNNAGTDALLRPNALHWLLVPMIAIIGMSFGLILVSQGADRLFNPQIRARHMSVGEKSAAGDGESEPAPNAARFG